MVSDRGSLADIAVNLHATRKLFNRRFPERFLASNVLSHLRQFEQQNEQDIKRMSASPTARRPLVAGWSHTIDSDE